MIAPSFADLAIKTAKIREISPLLKEARDRFPNSLSGREIKYESFSTAREVYSRTPLEGNGGNWEGERGNSHWRPDPSHIPPSFNPENKKWETILKEFKIEAIEYERGDLNLEKVCKGEVKIDEITSNRSDNFDKADLALAEQRGCDPEEVRDWRKENGYTWHERRDGRTMQKSPLIIHGNVAHSGGVAEAKKREAA